MNYFNEFNVGDLVEIVDTYGGPHVKGSKFFIERIAKYENICATLISDRGGSWNYPLDCKWKVYLKLVAPISLENI